MTIKTLTSSPIVAVLLLFFCSQQLLGADSLVIHNLGHASVMLEFKEKVIHIDPRASEADYPSLPKADIICITHAHGDHYNLEAIEAIHKEGTLMIIPQTVKDLNSYSGNTQIMNNSDSVNIDGIPIEAVAMYNVEHKNSSDQFYHPKGAGNGYILTFNELRVYLAGDTENIPEMNSLNVDIAFIPMNLPYTMTPEMAADAAKTLAPKILYIYHFGTSNLNTIKELLVDETFEIRTAQSTISESTILTTTGNKHLQESKLFKIYPNPSNGLFTLKNHSNSSTLSICDIKGRIVHQHLLSSRRHQQIDAQFLPEGNYTLALESEQGTIIIQKIQIRKK